MFRDLIRPSMFRWLILPPSVIVGACIAWGCFRILSNFGRHYVAESWIDPIFDVYVEMASDFILGVTWVYIASTLAPTHKKHVALASLVIICAIAGSGIYAIYLDSSSGLWKPMAVAGVFSCIVGATTTCYRISSKLKITPMLPQNAEYN